MKYESAILKRLIDTYGVVGNPQYISEIIKEFIVQGKERYPDLFTYQADWLAHIDEFGLNPSYTVSYTGQSIYAPNTLEKPVKSAILKGSTKYRDIDTGEILETFEDGRNLELVSVRMPVLTVSNKNLFCDDILNGKEIKDTDGKYIARGASPDKNNNTFAITKGFKEATQYTFSATCLTEGTWTNMTIVYKDHPYNTMSGFANNTGTVTSVAGKTIDYIVVYGNKESYIYDIQLTKSPSPSSYEPHKTNILTVNEDVTLRGIEDVQDTLDCLTGEVSERIREVVLNGSENWSVNNSNNGGFYSASTTTYIGKPNGAIISDKLPTTTTTKAEGVMLGVSTGKVMVSFNRDSTGVTNLNSFVEKLAQNPITILYELETESIKTVDLTILDQNGQNVKQLMSFDGGTHFTTSSQEGSLLPTITVDVETDLEETLKVCSLEGNTL